MKSWLPFVLGGVALAIVAPTLFAAAIVLKARELRTYHHRRTHE